jgi:putative transposase
MKRRQTKTRRPTTVESNWLRRLEQSGGGRTVGIRIPDPLAKRLRPFFRNARRNSGRRTAALNITQSMSRKGNCWDNAPRESFFGTLKTELVHHREYPDRDTARRDLFAYIEGYYNRARIHSAIGYITPQQADAKAA